MMKSITKKLKNLGGVFHFGQLIQKLYDETKSSDEYVDDLRKCGVRIGENVRFRYPAHSSIDITRPCLIEMGNNLDINDNFTILTHDFGTFVFRECYKDFVNSSGKVKIGNNIVFGRNVTILKGVTVGDNCIIGAGSVITSSIPDSSVAAGVPAKVICTLEEYYKRRKSLQIGEALEYGRELSIAKGGVDKLTISDFTEEWVLFLSWKEYEQDKAIRKYVDFRLKGKIDIQEFFSRPKPYSDFSDFIKAIKEYGT